MSVAWQELLTGAAVMYVFDPSAGAGRRAAFRSGVGRTWRWTTRQSRRGLGRLPGIGRRWGHRPEPTDAELLQRVQDGLESVVQPSAIDVKIEAREVTLSGPILARDVVGLLKYVARVPGVIAVNNRLRVRRLSPSVAARRLDRRDPDSGNRRDVS